MTTPPNAPEAGSNGEREALRRVISKADEEDTMPLLVVHDVADAILAAGFTRRAQQHDDGERVACVHCDGTGYIQGRNSIAAEANVHGLLPQHGDPAPCLYCHNGEMYAEMEARKAAEQRCAVLVRERNELAENLATLERTYAGAAEVDARNLRDCDAAIARAEAAGARAAVAENQRWYVKGVTWQQQAEHNHQRAASAESRAAALASALREIADFNWSGAWRDNKSMNDVVDEMVASARAALAGNGNGTGEG